MPLTGFGFLLPAGYGEEGGLQVELSPRLPAAGAEFDYTVPAATYEFLSHFRARLVTNAVLANRQVYLQAVTPSGVVFASIPATGGQDASKSFSYDWLISQSAYQLIGGVGFTMPLFGFVFPPGYRAHLEVDFLQAGDQFTEIGLAVQRFLPPARAAPTRPLLVAPEVADRPFALG